MSALCRGGYRRTDLPTESALRILWQLAEGQVPNRYV